VVRRVDALSLDKRFEIIDLRSPAVIVGFLLLCNYFMPMNITEQDLEFNRKGILSKDQIEYLIKYYLFDKKFHYRIWAAVLLFAFCIISFRQGPSFQHYFNGFLLLSFFAILDFLELFFRRRKLNSDNMKVKFIEGKVNAYYDEVTINDSKKSSNLGIVATIFSFSGVDPYKNKYVVLVNNKKIYTHKEIFEIFKNEKNYKIYYISINGIELNGIIYGAIIVSAEEVMS
jgi:hypothetical protein